MGKQLYLFDIKTNKVCHKCYIKNPERLGVIRLGTHQNPKDDSFFCAIEFDGGEHMERCYKKRCITNRSIL